MEPLTIPLISQPEHFTVAIMGVKYQLSIRWSGEQDVGWFLDIKTDVGEPLVMGIAMVTGVDLLRQFNYLFPFSLFLWSDVTKLAPGRHVLGREIKLLTAPATVNKNLYVNIVSAYKTEEVDVSYFRTGRSMCGTSLGVKL